MPHKNQGFTLIEIAIVLTIIGLIIGGILTGKTLIRNAQLQSVIKDVDRYKRAVQLFKEKYLYLPGDLPTATSFWGADTTCPGAPANANIIPKTATCNGNGDGFIGDSNDTLSGGEKSIADPLETLRMWQHLANARFIDGSYNGTYSSRTAQTDPGMNTPLSKVPGGTFLLRYAAPTDSVSSSQQYPANYRHVIIFGAPILGNPNITGMVVSPVTPILTTTEAMSIDQKIDDGFPGTGNVMCPWTSISSYCVSDNGRMPPGAYKTSVSGTQCALAFITGF